MKALLIIDVQNDFCKNGSLAIPDGETIVPYINNIMNDFDLVIATKDWHPENHSSFKKNSTEGIWPSHCVKGTKGAELHPDLNNEGIDFTFSKGTNPLIDSYSGFFENDQKTSTGLGEFLKLKGVDSVHIVGLALDYCVKFTAIDSLKFDLKCTVDLNATKGVNISPEDSYKAIYEMKEAGINIINE